METVVYPISKLVPGYAHVNGAMSITPDHVSDEISRFVKHDGIEKFDKYRVTAEKYIEQPEPTITIGGGSVASPGNVSVISAAAKAGKTAAASVLLAGALSETDLFDGFGPDLCVRKNAKQHAVIAFDTEQSEADQQYKVKTVLKRIGLIETPDHYLEYNIRSISITDYQKVTDEICHSAFKRFGGIHLIIIDGGADYILSVNDESAASLIVQYFIHLSIKFNCAVIVIIHQNPGTRKERGHFGSELQRKCYSLIEITKDGDISTMSPKMMRKAGVGDVPNISFKYCREKGYHIHVEPVSTEHTKAENERKKCEAIAKKIFKHGIALTYSEAVSEIMIETSKQERTAKTMIKNMLGWKLIIKGDDGRYRILIQ